MSATAGCIGATEVVKILTGIGQPLAGRMIAGDLSIMRFRTINLARDPDCPDCGGIAAAHNHACACDHLSRHPLVVDRPVA